MPICTSSNDLVKVVDMDIACCPSLFPALKMFKARVAALVFPPKVSCTCPFNNVLSQKPFSKFALSSDMSEI